MIKLDGLTKSYMTKAGRRYVFKDLSFDIPSGVNVAILGHNGAGKSTLLRIIGGIDFPDSGVVRTDLSVSWPVGLSGGVQGSMTGLENAMFVCRVHGVKGRSLWERVAYVKDFSELGQYFDMPVKTYSSGMKARLNFAISMAFHFDVYLIDEVMSVGDHSFRKKCAQAFDERRSTSSLIMVSHDTGTIERHCEIGLVLHDGQLQAFDDIKEAVRAHKANRR